MASTITVPPVVPAGAAPAASRGPSWRRKRESRAGYGFLTLWLAGFFLLTVGPMVASLVLSFTDYDLFTNPEFVGVDNYAKLFTDERFLHAVQVTSTYVLVATPVKLAASLAVAMLLNSDRRGQGFYRSAFYAPSLIGASVAIAIIWKALFIDDGVVARICAAFGWDSGGWVGNPDLSVPMLVLLSVWTFGGPMVIFLAGLKQIPKELYEAAEIDGANPLQSFWNITIPSLSPVLFFNLLMETIHAFQAFNGAYVISGGTGAPSDSTLFYTLYLYIRGFSDFRMGYASAMAWVLAAVVALISVVLFRSSKFWVHYRGDE